MADEKKFEDFTNAELKAIAEEFAVELPSRQPNKKQLVEALDKDGVTFELYRSLHPANPSEPAPVELAAIDDAPVEVETPDPVEEAEEDNLVVLRMTRKNHTYQIRGYQFTQQHPYALVTEEDADYLIEEDGGFQMATPKQLREFYGA